MALEKFCPKCGGNVFPDWECREGKWFEFCLQCGFRHYLPVTNSHRDVAIQSETGAVKAKRQRKENASLHNKMM
ncbi:MAG: hypothetical protein R6U89_01265 [Dehalococcoidia bacterium]